MSKYDQIFVKMDMQGKSTITISREQISDLGSSTTVGTLKKAIADKEGVDDVRLIYGGKQLSKDEATLGDYNLQNEATLFGVLRLLGGAQAPAGRVYKFKKQEVEKLKGIKIGNQLVDITVEENGRCGICWENTEVAMIHNGHKVCSGCMADHTRAKVFNGEASITCPISCQSQIPSFVAFTVSGLNGEEEKEWDLQMNKNAMCFKECPNGKCGQFIMKEVKEQRVRCPKCKAYDFCWVCLEKWQGSDNVHCGNPTCTAIADAMRVLEESWNNRNNPDNKKISDIEAVPQIRVCPNPGCLRTNEHFKACKHMTCKGKSGCNHQYCHVCLKKWKGCKCAYCEFLGGNVPECAGLGTQCNIHPLQTF